MNVIEVVGSGFSFTDRGDSGFKASAKKHLLEQSGKLDPKIEELKNYQ